MSKEEVFKELSLSENGLSSDEFKKRFHIHGLNELSKNKQTPQIIKFIKQFNSPLIYILILAAIISFNFNQMIDGYVILAVVFINASIGYIQERKAEKAIQALEKLIVSYAKVIRNGELIRVSASQLVPGDLIVIDEGDKIPADARLIEVNNFRTQESSLTGESFPVEKNIKVLSKSTNLADRVNMIFMGTIAVSGSARAIIVSTSNKTEIGKIAKSLQEVIQPKMHFNEKVSQLTFLMAMFAIIGASLIFLVGRFINDLAFYDIFMFTLASLVSGIPEGLPAVLTIILAVGASRMAKRNAVIRHLPAVETLGVATVIVTDKTGTLTENKLMVKEIVSHDGDFSVSGEGYEPIGKFSIYKKGEFIDPTKISSIKKLVSISYFSNKSNLIKKEKDYDIVGDPTEAALLVFAKKTGITKEEIDEELIDDLPFNSDLKFRASLVHNKVLSKREIYSIGAFETILSKSSFILSNGRRERFERKTKDELLHKAEAMAKKGYRVLGLAFKPVSMQSSISGSDVEDMTFVGFLGMKDPSRSGVEDAIKKARKAGIRIIMSTGDHKNTALSISQEIGLVNAKDKIKVLIESDIEKMDRFQLANAVKDCNIFARITPKTKMRIIQALQEQGEVVAMTGDGVNDAPALKRADIGIAMGIMGTDVARESSEIVLTDDNFVSIVNAIEEGRIVFQNVRQASFYLISTNVAEHVTIVSSLLLKSPLPLLPIQILYMNLVTDTFNGLSLSMEPGHGDVLDKPPIKKKEGIINKELAPFIIIVSGLMVLGTLPLFLYFLPQGLEKAYTVAFASMTMFQLFNVWNMRSLHKSIFSIGLNSNKWVIVSVTVSFLLMISAIYIPLINSISGFEPLSIKELSLIVLISSSVLIVGELYKRIRFNE